MIPAWSVRQEIIKRVNEEAEVEWAKQPEIAIPKMKKQEVLKYSPGWTNFFLTLMKELKP